VKVIKRQINLYLYHNFCNSISLVFPLFFFLSISCNNPEKTETVVIDIPKNRDTINLDLNSRDSSIVDSLEALKISIKLWSEGDYKSCKNKIKEKRKAYYANYQQRNDSAKTLIVREAGNYLFENLLNRIIPFWYGMPWCLSGYSNIPQEGTVGCSYFISNTLVDCGFNLNRFRLAQTDPIAGSRSLTFEDSTIQYSAELSVYDLARKIRNNHPEGIYIIGLDDHIGYLLIYKGKLYFIHSAYYYPNVVCMEYFEKSPAIIGSKNYYLTPISTNHILIEKWILNEFIYIQKPVYMKVDETRWNKQ